MHFRPGSDRVAITGHNYSRERLKKSHNKQFN
jgi:hypothetical protein